MRSFFRINRHLFRSYSSRQPHPLIKVDKEVAYAQKHGLPVVALESTILTHGMPLSESLALSRTLQRIAEENGSVAATVGILDGRICVGMSEAEQAYLIEQASKARVFKASIRDLPYATHSKKCFSTTVASTMYIANAAGVDIFATGGIGGVHRDADTSMDVSNDLTALGCIPVAVVCAGVKSILDIKKTLEVLETLGVPVFVSGSAEFPAFFSNKSGIRSPQIVDGPIEAAGILDSAKRMNFNKGLLFGVPLPEHASFNGDEVEQTIQLAIKEAESKSIKGGAVTPFLLERVRQLTNNKSIEANIALIKNNVEFAAKMASIRGRKRTNQRRHVNKSDNIVIIGGTNLDYSVKINQPSVKAVSDLFPPGSFSGVVKELGLGGVGRNISATLSQLNVEHAFLTSIEEKYLDSASDSSGVCTVHRAPNDDSLATARYIGVFNREKELLFGIADMEMHKCISPDFIEEYGQKMGKTQVIAMDANITEECMAKVISIGHSRALDIWYEPTDYHKSVKLIKALSLANTKQPIKLIAPNLYETEVMYKHITDKELYWDSFADLIASIRLDLLAVSENILLKLGADGLLFINADVAVHFTSPVQQIGTISGNVSGAGDSLFATVLHMRHNRGASWHRSILAGLKVVDHTMSVDKPTDEDLTSDCISDAAIDSFKSRIIVSEF